VSPLILLGLGGANIADTQATEGPPNDLLWLDVNVVRKVIVRVHSRFRETGLFAELLTECKVWAIPLENDARPVGGSWRMDETYSALSSARFRRVQVPPAFE
jgi:hypothetical protein